MDDMIFATNSRLHDTVAAVRALTEAIIALNRAADALRDSDSRTLATSEWLQPECEALETLTRRFYERANERACSIADQLGWQVATYEIAPLARESGNEPVVFITGNSYMPPLRDFGISNEVWSLADAPDVWAAYAERLESRLDEMRVYLAEPEYDNSLFVVDLARFEHVDDAELANADSLAAEWREIDQS